MATAEEYPHYIEFRHVYKTFNMPVLVDSNFWVDPGQTTAIIGRSGVGKSVTLAHIMGFLRPDSGRVIVAHEDTTDFSEADLRRISEPFFTTKQAIGGTGLGVAITTALLGSMGGHLHFESEPGRGTRVIVDLGCAS